MNYVIVAKIGLAWLYAAWPWAMLYLAFCGERRVLDAPPVTAVHALLFGGVALTIAPVCAAYSSLDAYCLAQPVLVAVGSLLFVGRVYWDSWLRGGPAPPGDSDGAGAGQTPLRWGTRCGWLALGVCLLAMGLRLLPVLIAGESFGAGDARFHHILASKILGGRTVAATWAPFAPIPVAYPQGTHALIAFLAELAGCRVHQVFLFLVGLTSALTTWTIYLSARRLFRSCVTGLFSAATYAFLPFWGSLDYLRWGGLPNALGMFVLCFMVLSILRSMDAERGTMLRPVLLHGVCILSIALVHHYTLAVAVVCLGSGMLFTADRSLRRLLVLSALAGAVFSAPVLALNYVRFAGTVGQTSVFVFREPLLTVVDCVLDMNVAFVALFLCTLIAAQWCVWDSRQLFILAWFTGMLCAFTFLEYVYRAGSLIATRMQDNFTCLTPSRMATDLAYPMSLLCGFLPVAPFWQRVSGRVASGLRIVLAVAFVAAAGAAGVATVDGQLHADDSPTGVEAARWLNARTPVNSMVVGRLPHLEYLSWRETAWPPLPASEQRNHPSVLWKRKMRTVDDWLAWEAETGRPVFFVRKAWAPPLPGLKVVYANPGVRIMRRERQAGGAP